MNSSLIASSGSALRKVCESMTTRDLITIGASAGGVEALTKLVGNLAANLPAAVLVVLHQAPAPTNHLPMLLTRAGKLAAGFAQHGEVIRPGKIYLAPPDRHLLIDQLRICLSGGPRENLARPAIDPMFRSAAVAFGPRVIGIVLTGKLDDGADGLWAIKQCGGLAIVQDPDDAFYPEMPRNAMIAVTPDYRVALADMPSILHRLMGERIEHGFEVPPQLALEVKMSLAASDDTEMMNAWGKSVPYGCPQCGGPLWERGESEVKSYRCHVGHAMSANTLLRGQRSKIESALWTAFRSLEERARMLDHLSAAELLAGRPRIVSPTGERAEDIRKQARTIRNLLINMNEVADGA